METEQRNDTKLNEILGVALLGLAALAAAGVYFDAAGVFGASLRSFVFGIGGATGYVAPVILGAAGVLIIAARRSSGNTAKRSLVLLGLLLVISMWHMGIAPILSVQGGSYGQFLTESYQIGAETHSGGGLLGALLTYWTYTYLGLAGSWIVLIVGLTVCVLAVSNLSIRRISAEIGSVVRASYQEHVQQTGERRERRRFLTFSTSGGGHARTSGSQAIDPKQKLGGRRKSPAVHRNTAGASEDAPRTSQPGPREPQPELDAPFSVTDLNPTAGAVPKRPFVDNVIELSSHRPGARHSSVDPDTKDITDELLTVNGPPVSMLDDEDTGDTETDSVYDPEPYREVFADTDIQFDDDPMPEAREKRRIDPNLVERVTGKFARVAPAAPTQAYHVETDKNRAGTAAVLAADTEQHAKPFRTESHGYKLPNIDLLNKPARGTKGPSPELQKNAALLEETLQTFNIESHVVNILEGPVVTRYELEPAPGIKVNRISNLADNIAMTLAASTIRIEAPVPGKSVVGIEIPNKVRESVGLRELLEDPKYRSVVSPVAFALGKDITGSPVYADIAKMPHLLVAGQTGAGKSVCINSLIISILYRASPDDVQMLMIDPKQVELSGYNPIPHLISEVVTDARKAPLALNWAVNEMNQRYNLFKKRHTRNLKGYNDLLQAEGEKKLPHILIVVDELAELMMTAKKEVEEAIQRIAQLGRAAGMHLVIATQRPTVDVITGLIKANVPGRIGFSVKSPIDSRTILDVMGAEKLLGRGDMLFYTTGLAAPERIQGCNVTDEEIARVVEFVSKQDGSWRSRLEFDEEDRDQQGQAPSGGEAEGDGRDAFFVEAIRLAVENEGVSTSFLQRRLRIGYGRAARLLDELEMEGIISGPNGSRAREVLITREDYERLYAGEDSEI